ncbi:LemA family protein [Erwinia sorbitola]|uniref:LemA family protein n=1 Tax=Erwinia sorbitola TaxID=2681984 RepID=A0A6I6EKE8_9GAMM|nr:LemA family protein [Erwinia sorbitola]QGU89068.1 LemA family protein [Erwinia sorbitola]
MSFLVHVRWLLLLPLMFWLSGCDYNQIQQRDEAVSAEWSEVLNQYQRRADLIPNLVATAQANASHEAEVFKSIADARAKIGSLTQVQNAPEDAQTMQAYQQSQSELSSAMSRLLIISERYPDLKADKMFNNLMVQLEGTENRITVARQRYVRAVQEYNLLIRQFPGSLTAKVMGYQRKENFQPKNVQQISTAPEVDFTPPAHAK